MFGAVPTRVVVPMGDGTSLILEEAFIENIETTETSCFHHTLGGDSLLMRGNIEHEVTIISSSYAVVDDIELLKDMSILQMLQLIDEKLDKENK